MASLLGFNRVHWTSVDSSDVVNSSGDEENQAGGVVDDDSNQVPDISDSRSFQEDETADISSIVDMLDEEEGLEDVHLAEEEESTGAISDDTAEVTPENLRASPRMTLRELEEERDLTRRRTSACVLLAVFFLFRLWIEALTQADLGLLMLSLVGTSWCARWIRHNREREEELDRRIAAYSQNNSEGALSPDLRMLSFQAQLALALMESQRTMMQGGFGHPDGQQGETGVTDEVRTQWKRIMFKDVKTVDGKPAKYESVAQDEGPSCSICLCEYEPDETLVQLPCGHEYHDECITSWTDAHSKCPLCNLDLESVAETETSS